ncbi:MAG: hypothetical protein QXS85_03615 [Acidilobaceae archaeon]
MSALNKLVEQEVVRGVASIASALTEPESYCSPLLSKHLLDAVRNVGLQLRVLIGSSFKCPLCGRVFTTKRGYFLHLTRSHKDMVIHLVFLESERVLRSSKRLDIENS